jgi:very-short-patch-repair endonuclease
MILVVGGLPRPEAQVSIHDRWGRFLGRPDLYYRDQKLGIEYDGGTHRDTMADDNRRQNRLLRSGVRLLRFTAGDVLGNPGAIVAQVGALLRERPTASSTAGARG